MRRFGPMVALCLLAGCGRPAAAPRKAAAVARPTASERPHLAAAASCAHLAVHRLGEGARSDCCGIPHVWLTGGDGALRVWYPGGYRAPYRTALLDEDGSLSGAVDVTPFAGLGEADGPVVASHAGVTALVASVHRSPQNADIMLALQSKGVWHKPIAVLPDTALEDEPALAFGAGGIGIAFRRSMSSSLPDLSFAKLSLDGRVLSGGVVVPAAGIGDAALALVGLSDGFLLLYTPDSEGSWSRLSELGVLRLDGQGHVVARHSLLGDAIGGPIAAWNGREVGVAFTALVRRRSVVAFVRFDPHGRQLADPVVVDRHPDRSAGFRAMSLIPAKHGWWLADAAAFVAGNSEGRVVELDAGGRPEASIVVSDRTGAWLVRLAAHGSKVRGVYVEDDGWRLEAFDIGCGKAPPPPPEPDACAAHAASFPRSGFAPLRGLVESTAEVRGDLVVGYRPFTKGPQGPAGDVQVSRMSADGKLAWTTDLGAGHHVGVAISGRRVAALFKTAEGRPEWLAILDAKNGAVEAKHQLASNTGDGCIAATRSGWLVMNEAPVGRAHKARALILGKDGALRARHDIDDRVNACSLLPAPGGFLLAYTEPDRKSATNPLFVRKVDENGRALGAGKQIAGISYAMQPTLYRRDKLPLVVFEGPVQRTLSAVVLDDSGAARSGVVTVAKTYGMLSATLWGDAFVWSTREELGRRGCLDRLLAP